MNEKDKKHFRISIAGHTVEINALYEKVYLQCEEYLSEHDPDVHIFIEEKDIALERSESEIRNVNRKDDYLETLAVYRKISEEMLSFDTFLMHGAVVAIENNAYLFTAGSGTGKTTHIKKWLENVEGAFVVNGDKPLITVTDTQAIACGTPWCGKEHWSTDAMVPLKAVVLMERGENNAIEQISYGEAFVSLLKQTYWPEQPERQRQTLRLLSRMKGKVRFYKFIFNNLKEDAFEVSHNALVVENEDT